MKLAIIGAGACGLMVGAYLSDNGFSDYTIYERNSQPGRKILASGNGRCNISNLNLDPQFYHNESYFTYERKDLIKYLEKNNLRISYDEEGRIYPFSNCSKSVLDFLLAKQKGKIIYGYEIKEITYQHNKYKIQTETYDFLVLATGSIANIDKKKQTGIYDYLASLNLQLTKLKPSLVGFKIKNIPYSLAGVRLPAEVTLYDDKNLIHKESGEVIFKKDGISGIVIMNMSFYYNHFCTHKNSILELNLYPDLDIVELKKLLTNKEKLAFNINPKLWEYLKSFKNDEIVKMLKQMQLEIISPYDFADAQVVSGGLEVTKLTRSFQVKGFKNLYCGGELVDVDGVCGGYNLTFAFNSGLKIAREILGELKK